MPRHHRLLEEDYKYCLFGIVSAFSIYRIVYFLNICMNWRLEKKLKELDVIDENNRQTKFFNWYQYLDKKNEIEYSLIENQGKFNTYNESFNDNSFKIAYILPNFKNFQYILKITDGFNFEIKNILIDLKNVRGIQYINHIEMGNVKSKQNFLF